MPKKLIIRRVHSFFENIKRMGWYKRIHTLPLWIKIILGIILISIGVLGILFPLIPGFVFILVGIIMIIGMHQTKRLSLRFIYRNKIHILASRFYIWWKKR